jgi:HD-GYP domain-containing protein (c-di-GMP phosphodiesterase class II)
MVRFHQERYDGKGYPQGLKGEEIPTVARIIAVADAFDAMTTDRPYRNKISTEEACKEISKNTGKQFDPQVVKAFLSAVEKKLIP